MKKRNTLKILLIIVVVITITVLLTFSLHLAFSSTKQHLSLLMQESPVIPAYNCLAHFYIDGNCIDWYDLLKNNKIEGEFAEVLVVHNDRIFFVATKKHESGTGRIWSLFSVDKNGENLLTHFDDTFGLDGGDNIYRCNNVCRDDYWVSKNGFYHDGKIVLTDHVKSVAYDIENGNITSMPASEFIYPKNELGFVKKDSQTLLLDYLGIQRTITPDVLAKSSQSFTNFMELEQKTTWHGKSRLARMFSNVQTDGENIYIVCSAFNWSGETYAVVFQYDIQTDNCDYCFYQFAIDSIDERFYIVPTI